MPLRYHMHYRKAKKKNNFGSVTFCCVVFVYTHYNWVLCMVKGLQAGRSVDSQNNFEVGMVKCIGTSCQLRLGGLTGQSLPKLS